jgi:hypothetical protein
MINLIKISIFAIALSNPNLEQKSLNNCLKAIGQTLTHKKGLRKKVQKIELIFCK